MSELIASLSEQPIIAAGMVLLVGLFAYAATKRLMKLSVALVLGFVAISAYFAFIGTEAPEPLRKVQEKISDRLSASDARDAVQEVREKVRDELRHATSDGLLDVRETEDHIGDTKDEVLDKARDLVDITEGI